MLNVNNFLEFVAAIRIEEYQSETERDLAAPNTRRQQSLRGL